jgi:Leucine-rich repeat (LRR) protein
MKCLFIIIFLLFFWMKGRSQEWVEITQVDSKGISRTIKTNRPDTLIKDSKPKIPAPSSSYDQPIFKTKSDSIQFEKTQRLIKEMVEGKKYDPKMMDSIFDLSMEIRNRIIGHRKVYLRNPDFFPFDSLAFKSDRSAIKQLSLFKVKSKKLPIEIFTCENLEELELVNTSIGRIQKKLNHLSQLKTLCIYNNKPKGSLKLRKNKTIDALLIRGDDPSQLPMSYSKFTALTRLNLAQNSLSSFPNGACKNKNLKELVLNNNAITLSNDLIKPHPSLEKLDLGKNQIKKVPASIGGFGSLKTLKFNHNNIAEVDGAISQLKKLEQISFYNNQLTAIPKAIYELTSLKEIDLYYNQIERLDARVIQWKKLEVLYLAFNKLFSLPDNLGDSKNLQELYLHNNRLSSLPESIGTINNLRILRVNNNLLTELPNSLSKLRAIENFDLSNNSISSIPDWLFNFPDLKILSLVANPWEAETKSNLSTLAKGMRARGVIVHLNSFDEEVE